MTVTPEQIARLPKWAQHELERLHKNVLYYANQLAGPGGRVHLNPYDKLVSRLFPEDTTVRFHLGDPSVQFPSRYFDVDIHQGSDIVIPTSRLRVSSDDYPMVIQPEAANSFYVELPDRKNR